ncbi:MAG: patatin-like phospholipase family protein [Burkholderiales bacterium]|nr:patatin-like phospholipase family protein [Burkholderiales bacterium]
MHHDTALVLPGGGARAAYQVGALRALARIHGGNGPLPFPVVCGTSAGALNAAAIAQHADDFRLGVARLVRWWRRIDIASIYRTDSRALWLHSAGFLAAVLMGTRPPRGVAALLDNAPLAGVIAREFEFARLRAHIDAGHLHALAIHATSYTTGTAVTFFEGAATLRGWQRLRRRGEPTRIGAEHLLASAAIPFLFAPERVADDYYMDGSVRQLAPLSAPLDLGARRLLIVAVDPFAGGWSHRPERVEYPSFAQAAGNALSAVFVDNLAVDVERVMQVNHLVDYLGPRAEGAGAAHVDVLVLAPSHDLGELALRYVDRLPRTLRNLLRSLGSTRGAGADLISYLLFDQRFCRALAALGYRDTMARRASVIAFLDADAGFARGGPSFTG